MAIATKQLITGEVEKFKIKFIKYQKYKLDSKYRDLSYTDTCWSKPNVKRNKLFKCRVYIVDIIFVLVLLESDDMIISSHMTWSNLKFLLKPAHNDSNLLATMAFTDTDYGVLEFHLINSIKEIMRMSYYGIIYVLWNRENIFVLLLKYNQ
jgi:hypothetical protein